MRTVLVRLVGDPAGEPYCLPRMEAGWQSYGRAVPPAPLHRQITNLPQGKDADDLQNFKTVPGRSVLLREGQDRPVCTRLNEEAGG